MAAQTEKATPSRRDSDEALDYFNAAMDELMSAKFILAERRIPDVLKTIAYFRKLYAIFEASLESYNHRAEFAAATVSDRGKKGLRMPKNRMKAAAFGFSILYDIDTERLSLRELTEQYFYHSDPSRQYRNFVNDILLPWRDAVEYLFIHGINPVTEQPVDTTLQAAAAQIVHELKVRLGSSEIPADKRQEAAVILDAVLLSLTPNRLELLRALLTGLKCALAEPALHEAAAPYLNRLFRLFASMHLL